MNVNLKNISGTWDDGYALDKHKVSSTYIGDDQYGHPRFDTVRTDAGEAVYQLKYRSQWENAKLLATAVAQHIKPRFPDIGLIVPMPASTARARQPVDEVAKELGLLLGLPVFGNIISKAPSSSGASLKNLSTRAEKEAELAGRFSINDAISTQGKWNVLLLDDLFDSGASMSAATAALRSYSKIAGIYAAALTWK